MEKPRVYDAFVKSIEKQIPFKGHNVEKRFSIRSVSSSPDIASADTASKVLSYMEEHGKENYDYVAREHFERLIFSTRIIEGICSKTDAILDVGSFPYFVPAYLSLKGFNNINTIDIPRPDLFPKPPEWKFRSFDLDIEESRFPFEDNSLDMIVFLEVFEHLYRRPNHVFREFARILKPGGKIFMSTPNGAALYKYWGILFKKHFGASIYSSSECYEKLGVFAHIREYSIQEIREYLNLFNFRVEDVRHQTLGMPDYSSPKFLKKSLVSAYFTVAMKLPFFPILQQTIFLVASNAKS